MKIGISGLPATGKSTFIKNLDYPFVISYGEAARKIYMLYPEYLSDLKKFERTIFDYQVSIESLNFNNMLEIFDRTIIDNIVFALINDDSQGKELMLLAKELYSKNLLKKYDFIYFFDLKNVDTKFIKNVINSDTLRQKTLAGHDLNRLAKIYKEKFLKVSKYFGMDVWIYTTEANIESFEERNRKIKEEIKEYGLKTFSGTFYNFNTNIATSLYTYS
jgi:dephospho-CoA kinase